MLAIKYWPVELRAFFWTIFKLAPSFNSGTISSFWLARLEETLKVCVFKEVLDLNPLLVD